MIRPATFRDLESVKALLDALHAKSKYAGRVRIDRIARDELLSHALMKQRSPVVGGSFFHVAEHDGRVEAFMIGVLNRVYQIGRMLVAQDLFLHATGFAQKTDAVKLMRAYIEWAKANPNVLEINASWSDTLPGAEKIEAVYGRLGFAKSGGIFTMALDVGEMGAAA